MIRIGLVLPSEFVKDARTPTAGWCLRCGLETSTRLDNLRSGQGGCLECGGKRRFSESEARMRAIEWGYAPDPNIAYVNDATKWPGTCLMKGHYCEPVLNSRMRSGPCLDCADHGFKPHVPAIVYIVTNERLAAVKVGICAADPANARLGELRRAGWMLDQKTTFPKGKDARSVEKEVLRRWRSRQWLPVLDLGMRYVGYTETVSLTSTSLEEIRVEVRAVAVSHGWSDASD